MPICNKCGKMQATAEMRRYGVKAYCKDKLACLRRVRGQ